MDLAGRVAEKREGSGVVPEGCKEPSFVHSRPLLHTEGGNEPQESHMLGKSDVGLLGFTFGAWRMGGREPAGSIPGVWTL